MNQDETARVAMESYLELDQVHVLTYKSNIVRFTGRQQLLIAFVRDARHEDPLLTFMP
jgi:hypothetical protein